LRILTLVYSIGIGGTERAAVNYAIGYHQIGLDSRVLVLGEGYDRLKSLQTAGVKVDLLLESNNKERTLEKIRIWTPHIIHIHNFSDDLVQWIDKVRSSGTKIVETNVFSRPNYSSTYTLVDLSMQLSKWGHWKYIHWMSGVKNRPAATLVPYPVILENFNITTQRLNSSFRKKLEIPETAFVVGRIGQQHQSKWDLRLVKVIQLVLHHTSHVYFILVGVPISIKNAIENKIGLANPRLKILPILEGDEKLSEFYLNIDCFAHISQIGESFGYVLAEAMLFKVPIVTMLTPFNDNGTN